MSENRQKDSGMDVDMQATEAAVDPSSHGRAPASITPNQNAVDAVNVPPPSRKGRHWIPQRTSDAKDSNWEHVSKEKVKAVMARYRQLQQEFWSKQLEQAPQVLPKNQETLQQRVTELLQRRAGARLAVEDEQPSAAAGKQTGKQQGQGGHKKMQPVFAKYSTNDTKLLKKQAYRLQFEQRLPAYVSWMYLVRNELATDKGQRMFYTDETGETVPASDDEDGNQECQEDLAGLYAALEVGLEEHDENVSAEELASRVRQLKEADQPKVAPTEQDRRWGNMMAASLGCKYWGQGIET
eukprot:gene1445-1786_t